MPVLVLLLASLLPAALALCRTCLPTAQLLMGGTCPPSRWVGVARPPHPHQACPLQPLQVPPLPWAVAWVLHPHHPRPPASTCPYCPHTQGRQARRPCPRLPRCTEWDRWASPARPPAQHPGLGPLALCVVDCDPAAPVGAVTVGRRRREGTAVACVGMRVRATVPRCVTWCWSVCRRCWPRVRSPGPFFPWSLRMSMKTA